MAPRGSLITIAIFSFLIFAVAAVGGGAFSTNKLPQNKNIVLGLFGLVALLSFIDGVIASAEAKKMEK